MPYVKFCLNFSGYAIQCPKPAVSVACNPVGGTRRCSRATANVLLLRQNLAGERITQPELL